MEWLFGKKKTPAEMLRENKRMLDKAIRELDRERIGLQNQEKKTVAEIKKMAKEGQMVRTCCRELSQRLMHLCISSSSTVTAEGVQLT
jgi:hypothetical protein